MDAAAIKILVVDDDVALLGVMEQGLRIAGKYDVRGANTGTEALSLLESESFDIVVTDYALGDTTIDGLDVLRRASERRRPILGIIVTAYASIEISIEAIRLGAYDFLTKPFQLDELQLTVRNAAEQVRLGRENEHLRNQVSEFAGTIAQVQEEHAELVRQLRHMADRSSRNVGLAPGAATRPGESRGQLQAYLQIGETISERLERENKRLQKLYEQGLIPEPTLRRRAEEESTEAFG